MNQQTSQIPKPPKGIGVSRRLRIVMIAVVISIAILFLIFLHHYAPRPIASKQIQVAASNSDSAAHLIEAIQSQHPVPIVVKANGSKKMDHEQGEPKINTVAEQSNGLTKDQFKAGSESTISAYHKRWSQAVNSNFTGNHDSVNSMNNLATHAVTVDKYDAQNKQAEKAAFLENAKSSNEDVIDSRLTKPISRYEAKAGTIIPATLVTGINSDLPGEIIGRVRRDVFDTVTGNYLLIPQGTTIIGSYDSQVAFGQQRVLIVWTRLIFPNGHSFDLRGQPGVDLSGLAGLQDKVDNHYFRIFGSALMFSIFGAIGQLSQPQNNSNQLTSQQIIYGAIGQQLSQTATQLIAKNMDIQPTIKIRPGMNFNVLLTRDMVLPTPYQF